MIGYVFEVTIVVLSIVPIWQKYIKLREEKLIINEGVTNET